MIITDPEGTGSKFKEILETILSKQWYRYSQIIK